MTTESKQDSRLRTRKSGVSPLLGAAIACVGLVAVLGVVGLAISGSTALTGSLTGGALALAVFLVGTTVVDTVAGLVPAMSLLIAMLTYVLQVVLMALVVLALVKSGVGGDETFRQWFAASVIAVTMAWLAVQVWLFTRLRIPAFDLPDQGDTGGQA